MHSSIPCVISNTRCGDEASLLSLAFIRRDSLGADSSVGGTSITTGSSSRHNTACLASCCSRNWSWAIVRMRSEAVFQWSLDGGLRVITNFGLWKRSVGIAYGTYSNSSAELSPKKSRKTYPVNKVSSRLSAPKGVDPEASELDRNRGLLTYLQHFPAGHVQQDGVLQVHQEHTANL